MKDGHWILDENGTPVPVDLMTWAQWFEGSDRILKQETVKGMLVSTVFLGIDHNFYGDGPPVLWETMVFPGNEMDRCSGNREQAEAMHERMVKKINETHK